MTSYEQLNVWGWGRPLVCWSTSDQSSIKSMPRKARIDAPSSLHHINHKENRAQKDIPR